MSQDLVNAQLTPAQITEINTALATLTTVLTSIGVNLTPQQRQELPKMGDKTLAFVEKAAAIAERSPDFLPRSFDPQMLRQDLELYRVLRPILQQLMELTELVDDTCLAVGSDAYTGSLVIYRYGKDSTETLPLDQLMLSLGKRFRPRKGTTGSTETTS